VVCIREAKTFPCLSSHKTITLRKTGESYKKINNKTGGYQIVSQCDKNSEKVTFLLSAFIYPCDLKKKKKEKCKAFQKNSQIFF